MTMEQLPPKGVKREQAILELGKDEANGELLLQLVNMEKGSWSMPPPPHCGPSWSRVNGWAAISWRTPVPTACRSRSPRPS